MQYESHDTVDMAMPVLHVGTACWGTFMSLVKGYRHFTSTRLSGRDERQEVSDNSCLLLTHFPCSSSCKGEQVIRDSGLFTVDRNILKPGSIRKGYFQQPLSRGKLAYDIYEAASITVGGRGHSLYGDQRVAR